MMWVMLKLSQCCSVTGIQGWGKPMSGRKDSRPEKDNVGVANDGQTIVP